jgi:hypothetical protein
MEEHSNLPNFLTLFNTNGTEDKFERPMSTDVLK